MINSLLSISYNAAVIRVLSAISVKLGNVRTSCEHNQPLQLQLHKQSQTASTDGSWGQKERKNNEVHGREEAATETLHTVFVHILKWLVEIYEGAEVP